MPRKWPYNKDCKCVCCESSRGNSPNKGKSLEELYGKERAKEMKTNLSELLTGHTWEERWGEEITRTAREKHSKSLKGHVAYLKNKTWEEYWGEETAKDMKQHQSKIHKGKPSLLKGRTYEEIYGDEEKVKKLKEFHSERMLGNSYSKGSRTRFCSGENHWNWKGGGGRCLYGYNWVEQRNKALKLYNNKSAISGETKDLHIHHIFHRYKYLSFILNDEFLSIFGMGRDKYLLRIISPYVIIDALVKEMNKVENLIPLTRAEHGKYENKLVGFFRRFQK